MTDLLEQEAKNLGLTPQELARKKVVLKRHLRILGFEISTAYYPLSVLKKAFASADNPTQCNQILNNL